MTDSLRDLLHSESENYDVFCERCQKVHKYYTFTREDHDKVIDDNAKALADAVDARALAEVYGILCDRR